MRCTRKRLSPEEETLNHLLGPTHSFCAKEMRVYNQASLCRVREADDGIDIQPRTNDASTECGMVLFKPLTIFPKPWMRQTYRQWKATMDLGFQLRQIKKRKVIYIQPLGINDYPDFISEFSFAGKVGFFVFLQSFCELFFEGFQVRLLPALDMEGAGWRITSRVHSKTQQKQLLVTDIQQCLQKCIPKDGYCSVGISWTDLYPRENLNFVLGDANAGYNSAVLCFGRFRPKTFSEGLLPPPTIDRIDGSIVWRMIKVITHETCHLLGMAHCKYFDCSMNESTSIEQATAQPLFLCPVCLRKLHKTAKFDMEQRYTKMLEFLEILVQSYHDVRIVESIQWLKHALVVLNTDENSGVQGSSN